MATTTIRGMRVGFDVIGDGEPLLLITGVGCQRVMWPDGLCAAFADRGFQVIRYDFRDVGESSRLDAPPPPPLPYLVTRALAGTPVPGPFDLVDLAGDAAALIEALGLGSAHVLGASMGGMIAQHLALRWPERVRTLTSMMSSPGGRRHLLGHPKVLPAFLAPRPTTEAELVDRHVALFRQIGSPGFPFEEAEHRRLAAASLARGHNPHAFARHVQAVVAERRRPIERIAAPTLVLHGAADPLVPARAGRATARAIPGARFVAYDGMGHDLPRPLWTTFAADVAAHALRRERASA